MPKFNTTYVNIQTDAQTGLGKFTYIKDNTIVVAKSFRSAMRK